MVLLLAFANTYVLLSTFLVLSSFSFVYSVPFHAQSVLVLSVCVLPYI